MPRHDHPQPTGSAQPADSTESTESARSAEPANRAARRAQRKGKRPAGDALPRFGKDGRIQDQVLVHRQFSGRRGNR